MNTQDTTNITAIQSAAHPTRRKIMCGVGIVVFLSSAVLSMLFSSGTAQADGLPPRPATPVPFEQPAEPTESPLEWSLDATPAAEAKSSDAMAYIQLKWTAKPAAASSAASTAYAVVQWQDPQKNWHDVDGWQGLISTNAQVRWSVYARDFGTGPFRWAIYTQRGGKLLGSSAPFQLPCCTGETHTETVTVGD